uniref:Uncharacterized protein n=1 Tax=Arundo donax TaxID=35708 RepID=A0A0A9AZT7_ARUDO
MTWATSQQLKRSFHLPNNPEHDHSVHHETILHANLPWNF